MKSAASWFAELSEAEIAEAMAMARTATYRKALDAAKEAAQAAFIQGLDDQAREVRRYAQQLEQSLVASRHARTAASDTRSRVSLAWQEAQQDTDNPFA